MAAHSSRIGCRPFLRVLPARLRQFSFFRTTKKNISQLQYVHKTLARIVACHVLPRGTHSSTILQHLHWLFVNQLTGVSNSNLPHWLITLATNFSQLSSALFLATRSWHVPYAPPMPTLHTLNDFTYLFSYLSLLTSLMDQHRCSFCTSIMQVYCQIKHSRQ